MATPTHDLARFLAAQAPVRAAVEAELAAGRKRTHWMWFAFPQLAGLGRSETARRHGLAGLAEARAYAAHPVLGARLRADLAAMPADAGRPAVEILGEIDAMKFRSHLSLFARAAPEEPLFAQALAAFFDGRPCPATTAALAVSAGAAGESAAEGPPPANP